MKRISYFLLFTLVLAACSTSKPKTDEGTDASAEALESTADEVGSTPEDLLAEETGGEEGANADPFADLKEEEAKESESTQLATDVEAQSSVDNALYGSGNAGQMETYTVKAGDTLMKIAFTIYGDLSRWRDLHAWNQDKLSNANALKRGTQIVYQAPETPFQQELLAHSYVIKKGDTLAGIADEVYGRRMKYRKLQRFNPQLIKDPHKIFAGFTIFYDITPQEMAEAEARRREKMAGQPVTSEPPSMPPSEPIRSEPVVQRETITPSPEPQARSQPSVPAPASNAPMVPSDAPVQPTMPQ